MADRYAIINAAGEVENVILWDGEAAYEPPEGMTLAPCPPEVSIGWTCVDGVFAPPPAEPEPA